MATASLLKANPLKLKLKQRFPNQLPSIRHRRNFACFIKQPNLNAKYSVSSSTTAKNGVVKCFFMKQKQPSSSHEFTENSPNPLEVVADAAVLIDELLMYGPYNLAMAASASASGGRMGGMLFSSRSSSLSRSYSTPSTGANFSYSVPFYDGGVWWIGVGHIIALALGWSAIVIFMFLLASALVGLVFEGPSSFRSDRSVSEGGVLTATENTTVLKIQVGLMGLLRSLQSDLNRIADLADTSTPEGLSYVLTETILVLLRHHDYCISSYSSVDVKPSLEDGEKYFNQLSIEERGKFDEETLVNVDNIKRQSTSSQRASGFKNEYLVITILVAAEGVHTLPNINGSGYLKEALQILGSIPSSRTMAVEVLWTPQNENDTLSERELLEDYPLLTSL